MRRFSARKLITGAVAAATLATTMVAATTPADAQRWRGGYGYRGGWHGGGYHRHGGVSPGAAVGIGLLGLGVGAAIASTNQPYYGGGYYAAPPPPPVAYYPAPMVPVAPVAPVAPAYGYYGGGYYGW